MYSKTLFAMAVATVVACGDDGGPANVTAPTNLFYVLDASGDPQAPAGLLLQWDPVSDPDLMVYRVYSRAAASDQYDLRGETTSTSFHDTGIPDLDYAVAAVNTHGDESALAEIEVDERLRLQAPNDLVTTSLNGAVYLYWTDNPFTAEPDGFWQYRVYSTTYSLDTQLCGNEWVLEGTTVAPEFISGALANGVSRCFGVSAESIEGWESMWSPVVWDTPRPDARNVLLYADAVDPTQAGFRFFLDSNGDGVASPLELGLVSTSASSAVDFYLHRDASQILYLVPKRTGTTVVQYGNGPLDDLTSIDIAPLSGYSTAGIEAVPGYGYVFEMDGGDGYARYGAVRPTHVGQNFILFDWSYQTDAGNPQLRVQGVDSKGVVVRRR
jgi:hypothetical protein